MVTPKLSLLLIAILLLIAPAQAQNVQPYVYALTIGISATQVLPANQSRKQLVLFSRVAPISVA